MGIVIFWVSVSVNYSKGNFGEEHNLLDIVVYQLSQVAENFLYIEWEEEIF